MICAFCNHQITKLNTICPNCNQRTGTQYIGMLNASIVFSVLGLVLGFGPTLYWYLLASGVMYTPLDFTSGVDLFFQGILVTGIGIILGLVGLVMFSIALANKKYKKIR